MIKKISVVYKKKNITLGEKENKKNLTHRQGMKANIVKIKRLNKISSTNNGPILKILEIRK